MQPSLQQRQSSTLPTLQEDGRSERMSRMSSHRAGGPERTSHCPTEITRWENEGGAVLKENRVERTMIENNT
jgi:hypothetical protein